MVRRLLSFVRSCSALGAAALFVLPLYFALVASFGESGSPPSGTVQWWPAEFHWENYARIFQVVPLWKYTLNSLIVVAWAVPLTVLTSSLAGFAISELRPPNAGRLVVVSVVLMLIPGAAVWLFRFQLLVWFGLLDTLWALILPVVAASSPLFVLLFYWNFRRIPEETFDAARMDGASPLVVWRRIALPLTRPTFVAVVILAFVFYWSDFISPVLYIYNPSGYTLPIGLQLLNQLGSTNWPILMAGAVYMTLPVLVLFILLQRLFLSDRSLAELFDRN